MCPRNAYCSCDVLGSLADRKERRTVVYRAIPDLAGRPVSVIAGQHDLASHHCAKVRGGESGLGYLAHRCHLNLPIILTGE
jgi:hypothetical protein